MREKPTEWQKMALELKIDLIAALSPEAKGRIERLWETLQGRLPYVFRYLGIDTILAANAFLKSLVDDYNARFAVPAADSAKHWRTAPAVDLDFLMSVKTEKKTRADGTTAEFDLSTGDMTDDERKIIQAGCLINFYRG